jgi:3-dehydroquinate dehydratase-2
MFNLLVLHGPNLNLLGGREPKHYGHSTLANINQMLVKVAQTSGHNLVAFQSNSESELLEQIHVASDNKVDFIIINPAAFTHTSIALRDALLAVAIPFIEVHLSNIYARESFRHHSYFSDVAVGVISGLGAQGYNLALQAALSVLSKSRKTHGH